MEHQIQRIPIKMEMADAAGIVMIETRSDIHPT